MWHEPERPAANHGKLYYGMPPAGFVFEGNPATSGDASGHRDTTVRMDKHAAAIPDDCLPEQYAYGVEKCGFAAGSAL